MHHCIEINYKAISKREATYKIHQNDITHLTFIITWCILKKTLVFYKIQTYYEDR